MDYHIATEWMAAADEAAEADREFSWIPYMAFAV